MTPMKAYLCRDNGAPSNLDLSDIDTAPLGPEDVRIETHYVGVNFADVMAIAGTHQFPPPMPFSPGFEASGLLAEVGGEVRDLEVGDRVMFTDGHGAYREEIVAHKDHVVALPRHLSLVQAAALPVAFGTPYFAFMRRARVRHGDRVLVVGAAGNIGSAAVQIAKLLGAQVLGIASGDGVERALSLGADHVIDYKTEDVAARIQTATDGAGVNTVFDPVLGAQFETLKGQVAAEGSYLVMGIAGGDLDSIPAISAIEPLQRNIGFLSADYDYYLHQDIRSVREAFRTMLSWAGRGWLQPIEPVVSPFEEAVSVLEAVAAKAARGKQVLSTRFAGRGGESTSRRAS